MEQQVYRGLPAIGRRLGVAPNTLCRLAAAGKLPPGMVKLGSVWTLSEEAAKRFTGATPQEPTRLYKIRVGDDQYIVIRAREVSRHDTGAAALGAQMQTICADASGAEVFVIGEGEDGELRFVEGH